jgi:hypothetical protein
MLIDRAGSNINLIGENLISGNGNNVNTADFNSEVLRMLIRFQEIIREKDQQIGRLISIIETIQGEPLKMRK